MKEYSVILQPQFFEELEVILYFFQDRYTTKRKIYAEVRNTVSSLSIFPERYSKINNQFNTKLFKSNLNSKILNQIKIQKININKTATLK